MSLVMLDLDHFKHINDDHGHAAGDEVLRCVAQLCRENFREVDIAGRLGGEEFVVLMPHTALRGAGEVARRFLQVLSDTEIAFEGLRLRVQATARWPSCKPRGSSRNPAAARRPPCTRASRPGATA
jgi:diguanylate cyclase (GGDEF)-like protein